MADPLPLDVLTRVINIQWSRPVRLDLSYGGTLVNHFVDPVSSVCAPATDPDVPSLLTQDYVDECSWVDILNTPNKLNLIVPAPAQFSGHPSEINAPSPVSFEPWMARDVRPDAGPSNGTSSAQRQITGTGSGGSAVFGMLTRNLYLQNEPRCWGEIDGPGTFGTGLQVEGSKYQTENGEIGGTGDGFETGVSMTAVIPSFSVVDSESGRTFLMIGWTVSLVNQGISTSRIVVSMAFLPE